MTLAEAMPHEFSTGGEYINTRAYAMRDVKVKTHNTTPWPGTHKNVHKWVVLENGYAVGWNENPAIGWSFPVKKMKY